MRHVNSLDGLRGIAVLCVVLFHFFPRAGAGLLGPIVSAGWGGVDLFFVLSGYLITRLLYEDRGVEHYYRNFYMRRALRLLPLYYFLFLIALVLTPALHISWRLRQVALVFHCANLVFPFDGSLAIAGPFNFFHLWSLSVEEQFYLIWPWIVGSQLSRGILRKICVIGVVVAPVLRLMMLHAHTNPWWIYQSLPTRMDALLMGALLALMPLPSLKVSRGVCVVALLFFSGLALEGRSLFFLSRPIQGLGYTALAVVCASILVMSLYPGTMIHRVCSWRALRFYGKYSYGIYLWHYMLLYQFGRLANWIQYRIAGFGASLLCFSAILACSTALAMMSYQLIERPLLKWKNRFKNRWPEEQAELAISMPNTSPHLALLLHPTVGAED